MIIAAPLNVSPFSALMREAAGITTTAIDALPAPGSAVDAAHVLEAVQQARTAAALVSQAMDLADAPKVALGQARGGAAHLAEAVTLLEQFTTDGPMIADARERMSWAAKSFTMAADRADNPPAPFPGFGS